MGEQALTYLLPALAESPYGLIVIAVIVGIYLAPQILKDSENSENTVDKKQKISQIEEASRDEIYLTKEAEGVYFNEVLKLRSELLQQKLKEEELVLENHRLRILLEEHGHDLDEDILNKH